MERVRDQGDRQTVRFRSLDECFEGVEIGLGIRGRQGLQAHHAPPGPGFRGSLAGRRVDLGLRERCLGGGVPHPAAVAELEAWCWHGC